MIKILNLAAAFLAALSISAIFLTPQAVAEETVAAEGTWTKKSFKIQGGWSIVEKDGAYVVKLDEAFRTKNAPDLKIFLSPLSVSDLKNKNAIDGAVFVEKLASNKGAQTYEIPAGTDLSQFQSIIIHCEAYTKLWGAATI
ncbi:MAG: DM13 domain-containing protein [Pseudomonadota bacterium]